MKGELHIIPDLCNEEAIYYVFIGDEYTPRGKIYVKI